MEKEDTNPFTADPVVIHQFIPDTLTRLLKDASRKHGDLKTSCKELLFVFENEHSDFEVISNKEPLKKPPRGRRWEEVSRAVVSCLGCAVEKQKNKLTLTALICLEKLIAYNYIGQISEFPGKSKASVAKNGSSSSSSTSKQKKGVATGKEDDDEVVLEVKNVDRLLIDRVVDVITSSFSPSLDDETLQLQIVKCFMTAVTHPAGGVHGESLLNAVRTCYNVYLVTRSVDSQGTAKASLEQMLEIVFQRLVELEEEKARRKRERKLKEEVDPNENNNNDEKVGDNGKPDQHSPATIVDEEKNRKKKAGTENEENITKKGEKKEYKGRNGKEEEEEEDDETRTEKSSTDAQDPREDEIEGDDEEEEEEEEGDDEEDDEDEHGKRAKQSASAASRTSSSSLNVSSFSSSQKRVSESAKHIEGGRPGDDVGEEEDGDYDKKNNSITKSSKINNSNNSGNDSDGPSEKNNNNAKVRSGSLLDKMVAPFSGNKSQATEKKNWVGTSPDRSEIFTDSFLIFRALCKLSMKPPDPRSADPFKSKVLSMELLLLILEQAGSTFRKSKKFVEAAIRKYLCIALLKKRSESNA